MTNEAKQLKTDLKAALAAARVNVSVTVRSTGDRKRNGGGTRFRIWTGAEATISSSDYVMSAYEFQKMLEPLAAKYALAVSLGYIGWGKVTVSTGTPGVTITNIPQPKSLPRAQPVPFRFDEDVRFSRNGRGWDFCQDAWRAARDFENYNILRNLRAADALAQSPLNVAEFPAAFLADLTDLGLVTEADADGRVYATPAAYSFGANLCR